MTRGTAFIL